ncbi:MAG: cytochrome c-type biogenesis protein CcmH [Hyphomonas sp.]|nr:cytochrome c-type biogenesis protein CcmH [Hyphomonas sp.]
MIAVVFQASVLAHAQAPIADEFSPEVEAEAREVGKSLRCVVCQNQSIEDSGAPLAADMRQLVRERLAAGDSPDQVRRFMQDRYGNFVLMKPPFQSDTLLLWLGPILFLSIATFGWLAYIRPRTGVLPSPEPLSEEEQARLSTIMPPESED